MIYALLVYYRSTYSSELPLVYLSLKDFAFCARRFIRDVFAVRMYVITQVFCSCKFMIDQHAITLSAVTQ